MFTVPKIQVVIRKRPLNEEEVIKNKKDIVSCKNESTCIVKEPRTKLDCTKYIENHKYHFDWVFGENKNNQMIYKNVVQPLIQSAFEQTNITCFAYGQTGSGKTYTMMGDPKLSIEGLYLLASKDIFYMLKQHTEYDLKVGVSFYEIYCGKAFDLLNDREECPIRVDAKDNTNIVGLNEKIISNTETLMNLIDSGLSDRITSKNSQNDSSSRSHAILEIVLRNADTGKKHGKMSFIDLAGNERGADVKNSDKQTQMDGAEINKSLLALKECIRALDQGKKHLPFRGSKLTLVLKDSFQGKCQSVMIATITPTLSSCEYTLNTLRYADRVRELKKGKKNRGDEMMLSRNNKKIQKEEFEKPKVDGHKKFDYYDVNDKNAKTIEFTGFPQRNKSNQESLKKLKKNPSYQDNLLSKSKDKSQGKSFLKGNRSKSPMFAQYQKSLGSNVKNPIQMQHSMTSDNLQQNSFQKQKNANLNISQTNINIDQELGDVDECQERLFSKYQNYLDNLQQVDMSERRNLELWEQHPEKFFMCFDKMKQNLDKKIQYINKIKKEIHRVNQHLHEQKKKKKREAQQKTTKTIGEELLV